MIRHHRQIQTEFRHAGGGIPRQLTHCPLNNCGIASLLDRIDEARPLLFHFNPLRQKADAENLLRVGANAWAASGSSPVLRVGFDDEPEIPRSIVIRGTRADNWIWQKEAIVNLALKDPDASKRCVARIDQDMAIETRLDGTIARDD
ncbi:hypothetical protein K227x_31190 [Rubripirellula lacrimiformis]|uniref:Uncharacterized protein n=2 Tax=Rubripirellula lacrimiformis TaxID=1930273 RepID=A0A517NC57_9BACT|nr:hypothetical protein K227x_31190 [Rubripirellula lacrimiformis]